MNWMDGFIIVILVVSTIKGYSRGLVMSLVSSVGFVAAIIAARLYFGRLAQYMIENTFVYQNIYIAVTKGLGGGNPVFDGNGYAETGMPEFLKGLMPSGGGVPVGGSPAASNIAQAVSGMIISLISIALIFIVVRLIFAAVAMLLDPLVKLPVIRQFNRLGGIVVGFLKGSLGLMLVFALLIPIMAVFPAEWLVKGVEESTCAGYFYSYNLIIPWVLDFVWRITGGV